MSLSRAPTHEVTPLEVWDQVIAGQPLFAWQGTPSFPERVVQLVRELALDATVYVAGGRPNLAAIALALRDDGHSVVIDHHGPYAGAIGAARLAGPDALGVDIGQTSIKAWVNDRRVRSERDWQRLPLEIPGMSPATLQRGEDDLVAWVGATTRELTDAPTKAVIAIPAAVDAACCAAGSSYPYVSPNPRLLQRIARAIGAADTIACNDAELVAHTAASVLQEPRILTLTFGWGVGAALLQR